MVAVGRGSRFVVAFLSRSFNTDVMIFDTVTLNCLSIQTLPRVP